MSPRPKGKGNPIGTTSEKVLLRLVTDEKSSDIIPSKGRHQNSIKSLSLLSRVLIRSFRVAMATVQATGTMAAAILTGGVRRGVEEHSVLWDSPP